MKNTIKENAESMGLVYNNHGYYYSDKFSNVSYKELETVDNHEVIPLLGIYTKSKKENSIWEFQDIVSYLYNFVGNEYALESIKDSIRLSGLPIFEETIVLNKSLTKMSADIIIRNGKTLKEVGDVYPSINIFNSYDGRSREEISFGLTLIDGDSRYCFNFRNTLGKYRQVHKIGHKTSLSYTIGNYVEVVNNNIVDFINANFNNVITEDTLLETLNLIEEIGKRRHDNISGFLKSVSERETPITSWDLFLAITRFSTVEKNLNAKILLEDIIERTMLIPAAMIESFDILRESRSAA